MAKILNGILGGGAGKVGGVVMSNWKGIDTLRAYSVPSNPNSSAQQLQRGLFTGVQAFLKLILVTIIQPFWDPFAVAMSGFNVAMSKNLLAWADETAFDDAIVAQGNLELDVIDSCTYTAGTGEISLAWSISAMGNGLTTDNAVVVIIDTANNIGFVDDGETRQSQGVTMDIGADRTAADLKAYLFFNRGVGVDLEVSNSDFFQVTIP